MEKNSEKVRHPDGITETQFLKSDVEDFIYSPISLSEHKRSMREKIAQLDRAPKAGEHTFYFGPQEN